MTSPWEAPCGAPELPPPVPCIHLAVRVVASVQSAVALSHPAVFMQTSYQFSGNLVRVYADNVPARWLLARRVVRIITATQLRVSMMLCLASTTLHVLPSELALWGTAAVSDSGGEVHQPLFLCVCVCVMQTVNEMNSWVVLMLQCAADEPR